MPITRIFDGSKTGIAIAVGLPMAMSPQRVLVVAPNHLVADAVTRSLPEFETVVRADFEGARAELDQHPPDFLITELRLGQYNGLHLAIRAHAHGYPVHTIIIGGPDKVLEADAKREHAKYLVSPVDGAALSTIVREMLSHPEAA